MNKGKLLYEGKAKKIFFSNEDEVIMEYKDDATAFNGKKKGIIKDKGFYNAKITRIFFELLEEKGINTHYIKEINDREILTKKLEIIPIEVVVRNIIAGSLSRRLGIEEGVELQEAVLEFYYKDDELGDPLINDYHIKVLDIASREDIEIISKVAFKINDILKEFLNERGIDLVDFKLEFGRYKNEILLGDEISPDTCRFWDKETRKKMDKDRFRRDLGDVETAYQEVLERISK
jgi:phosphoribosylaminoimidazole-succinocarboxamide synthase